MGIENEIVTILITISVTLWEKYLLNNILIACPPSRVETGKTLNIPINRFASANIEEIL